MSRTKTTPAHTPYMVTMFEPEDKNEETRTLGSSCPDYHFDAAYGAMTEEVPPPYWKSGKSKPPTEIIQTAMDKWFVETSDASGDGYVVMRKYYEPQEKLRWTCTCRDFLIRRQGTEHPWCKHIYHVYEAFHNRAPEHAWIRFPFPEQAARYIIITTNGKDDLREIFWDDLEDLQPHLLDANQGKPLTKNLPGNVIIEPNPIIMHHTTGVSSTPASEIPYHYTLSSHTGKVITHRAYYDYLKKNHKELFELLTKE